MRNKTLTSVITTLILIGLTVGIFLYTAGYRVEKNKNTNKAQITQTGMINVKSVPDGANVYLNGELETATDGTIPGLEPGKYNLKILKNGFVAWEKQVEVFPELVTDITSILVSQSPRFEPLTNTGAREPTISPTLTKIAFFSRDGNAPGVWVIPLTGDALNIFRSNPYVVLEDTPNNLYSWGSSIEWSPDETQILVIGPNESITLVDLSSGDTTPLADTEEIRQEWAEETIQKRIDFIEKLDIPEELREIAVAEDTSWAPDGKKFLYVNSVGDTLEYRVYNMEKPIPVGENVESIVFTTNVNDWQPKVTWYADSFHLVMTEMNPEVENQGMVSLVRIDGTNKVELFNNKLYSDEVYSSPGGDKIILLTSFKSGEQIDLYTVGIR